MSGIRFATSNDVPQLSRLQEACWPQEMRDEEPEILRRVLSGLVLVFTIANVITGALFMEHQQNSVWHLYAIEVLPGHRHRGVATALLDAAQSLLGAASLTATAATEAGFSFLKRAGFVSDGALMRKTA